MGDIGQLTIDPTDRTPAQVRAAIAAGAIAANTADLCPGYVQANLAILPRDWAFEFLLFCQRNPRPCPVLEVLEPGQTHTRAIARGADIRNEIPRYRVWRGGVLVEEPTDIAHVWRDDLVSFLLGCSFSFDLALQKAGVPVRHLEMGRNVPMYVTNRPNVPAGRLGGPLVVSMRPMTPDKVAQAQDISGRYPGAHGAPIFHGDPAGLGIKDLGSPDFGDPVDIRLGEIPVFWACGVTPQAAVMEAKPELAITHAPGHMFITDLRAEEL